MEFDNIETIKQAVEIGGRRQHPARADRPQGGQTRLAGRRAADRPAVAAADRHHPPAAQGLHADGRQVRRTAARRVPRTTGSSPSERPRKGIVMRETEVAGHVPARRARPSTSCRDTRLVGGGGRRRHDVGAALRRRGDLRQVPRPVSATAPASRRRSNADAFSRRGNSTQGWRLACQTAVDRAVGRRDPRDFAPGVAAQDPRPRARTARRRSADPAVAQAVRRAAAARPRRRRAPTWSGCEQAVGPFDADLELLRAAARPAAREPTSAARPCWPTAS